MTEKVLERKKVKCRKHFSFELINHSNLREINCLLICYLTKQFHENFAKVEIPWNKTSTKLIREIQNFTLLLQCGKCRNLLSPFFRKNYGKLKNLVLNYILSNLFSRNILQIRVNLLLFTLSTVLVLQPFEIYIFQTKHPVEIFGQILREM